MIIYRMVESLPSQLVSGHVFGISDGLDGVIVILVLGNMI